jgi:hypothetical protein
MKSIKKLGLATAMALTFVACIGATSASATTVCVVGTTNTASCPAGQGPGGAIVSRSTNSSLAISGGGTVSCTTSSISGTAPATSSTTVSAPVTLRYGSGTVPAGSCTAFFSPATVTPSVACDPGGAAPITLNANYNAGTPFTTVTIPSGCTITISIPAISCTVTVSGAQTIGNGTAGAGGQAWTNGSGSVFSTDTINSNALNTVSSGGGFGCPSAGAHTGTLTGTYTVTTPNTAPGATIQS